MDNNNPLKLIFKLNSKGECTSHLESIPHISKFFEYLENNVNEENPFPTSIEKSKIILNFCNIIKENRTVIEFFSSYNERSLYFYLFDLYLNPKSSEELKSSIIILLEELRINIQTNKEIYIYLFNNLSLIYRGEIGQENFYSNLVLLNTILGGTENYLKPRNYFACNGEGKFIFDNDNKKMEIGFCLTFIMNFKINLNPQNKDSNICNLLKIKFNNKTTLKINLKSPGSLMIKDKIVKIIPQNEWVNLIINIMIISDEIVKLFFFVNGENQIKEEKYEKIKLKNTDEINSLEFFENFYVEVTSILLLSQKEEGDPGVLSDHFLLLFKQNREGIWKRKLFENFISNISKLKTMNINQIQETKTKKEKKEISFNKTNLIRAMTMRDFEPPQQLKTDLIFIFSPFNYIETCPNIIEDCLGQYHLFYYGNIRNHIYNCYQNKLHSVCSLTNLFPIAEMLLINPKLLNEQNLEILLKIIENILNYRKNNIKSTKYCKFFKVLCLFVEKYPISLFTEKILDSFANIGKTMFRNNSESLCKTYFKHILLNEKILSKYSSNLQIKFWNYIKLFCESDSSQIEKFININRISLLLRFYDRKKYKEICCKEHLDMFKEEYIKTKKIMDPPLNKKLSYIKDVLDVIIYSQTPKNSFNLFKLLTLDLSPCLVKFIINIFKKALDGHRSGKVWKTSFIKELINNKYEIILINAFIHSLPDVRIDILELLFLIHIKAINEKQRDYIEKHELMFKPFLLPTKIFYYIPKKIIEDNNNKINSKAEKTNEIVEEKKGNSILKDNADKKEGIDDLNNFVIQENKDNLENNTIKNKDLIKENLEIKDKEEKESLIKEEIEKEIEKKEKIEKEFEEEQKINNDNSKDEKEEKEKEEEEFIEKGESKINIDNLNKNNLDNKENFVNEKEKKDNINIRETEGILILKDEIFQNYIESLFSYFLLWSLDIQINIPYTTIHLQKSHIKDINIFQHLFEVNSKINDINFLQKLIDSIDLLMELDQNCFKVLYNKKIFSLLLDVSFSCFIKKEKITDKKNIYEQNYNKVKNTIIKIYINTLKYTSKKDISKFPSKELETIYIWGDKILMNEVDRIDQNIFHSFMDELLCELLIHFKVNFESHMEFNVCDKRNDILTGYFFNNYFIFISELFHYCFHYRLDIMIYKNGLKVIEGELKKEVNLPPLFVYSMRIDPKLGQKINDSWIDYKYIYEIYHRIKFIWQNDNLYKKYQKGKKKTNNKYKKYEAILDNILLNKNQKNIYKKELEFLYYEFKEEKTIDFIVPIIKIIQISMMCIISVYINKGDEKELLSWLKEFKQLLRFIIISSTNLTMRDQIEFYKKIQENSLYVITIGICFLIKCLSITKICKITIEKIIINTLMFCFFIEKFQINYFNSHKKTRIFSSTKFNRNDISSCAVVTLFNKYLLDKNEQIIFNLEYIDQILTEKHYYDKIRSLLYTPNSDLEIGLIKNEKIINLLNEKYFGLSSYKNVVDLRFIEINNMKDSINLNYSEDILEFLPLYEKELAKYSNNSLEKNLNKKNLYRKIKKHLFSWNGYWSDKSLFFEEENSNNIINKNEENKENTNNKNEIINNINNDLENNIEENKEIINNIDEIGNEKETINNISNNLENNIEENREIINNNNEIENKKEIINKSNELEHDKENIEKQSMIITNDKIEKIKLINNKNLKFKLLNHYTKSFMKPLLVPILDIEYYLPDFSGFDSKKLFKENSKQIINLNIDQILKIEDSQNLPENTEIESSYNDNNINNNDLIFEEKKEKEENYLREIYIKSNPVIAEQLLKISNNLDFGKEEEEYIEENTGVGKSIHLTRIYFLSCLVKASHHIKGVCFVDENQLNFKVFLNQKTGKSMNGINLAFTENDEDYDPERKTCYGSYFMFHHKDKNLYKISIKYSEIKWIFRRRYYYKNSALEIFTNKNKSFYFNFKYENDREVVLQNILKKLKDYNKIVLDLKDTKDSFDNVVGYQHNNIILDLRKTFFKKKVVCMSEKIDSWKKWKISNFEFLMWLNIYSNRSYNDISQYPIFPWTLIDFEDPLRKKIEFETNNKNTETSEIIDFSYRDLSTPIGMLAIGEEGEKRKENFILNYEELKNEADEFEGQKPYYYGSNYSNPIYTCNFLIRVFPFTHISIELQGDKIDNSDRLFFSVQNTFITCTSLKTDVRELIPEFFYLPEMLLNSNNIELGKRDDGSIVNDVLSPCNNNPYKFIQTMKYVLESNKVGYNLQNWIDLIFGIKARGKEAELAKNIFSEASYQENINLNKVEDKNTYLRMVEFGLIPNQILTKECTKREKKEDVKKGKEITDKNAKLKKYIFKSGNIKEEENLESNSSININSFKNQTIIKAKLFNNDKIILFKENNIIEKRISYSVFDKSFSDEIINNYNIGYHENRMKYYFSNNKNQDKSILFCNQGKTLILGGFYDGSIKILNYSKNIFKKIIPFKSEEPILSLALDEEEKYLFVGNSKGNIIIYEINFENYEWKVIAVNTDQLSEISHIDINSELNLWLSASEDGFINLYTLPCFKLVRSIKTKAKKLDYAFLSTSTLPSILVINRQNKYREIFSYSINGKFLKSEKIDDILLNPLIIKDLNFNEYLVYICKNNNSIEIRNLPFLEIKTIIKNIENISVICISDDNRILYAISNEDDQICAIKDHPKQVVSS